MLPRFTWTFRILLGLVLAYWAFLFYSTHVPINLPESVDSLDKVVHATAYGLLAIGLTTVLILWRGPHWTIPLAVWLLAVAYGSFDEYTQQFCEGRTADVMDLLADAFGAMIGASGTYAVMRLRSALRFNSTLRTAVES